MKLLLLLISVLPVILLGLYIYNKDSEKEPKKLIFKLFISGLFAALIVLLVNIVIQRFLPDTYDISNKTSFIELFLVLFIEVALLEEFSKWLMIRIIGYNNKEFDQLYDIIVYSVFVALGFAFLENLFYVLPRGVTLGFSRALFSVPGHVCFGIFMGVFLGFAKIYEEDNRVLYYVNMFFAVFIPTMLHTVYNFCLMTDRYSFFILFIAKKHL